MSDKKPNKEDLKQQKRLEIINGLIEEKVKEGYTCREEKASLKAMMIVCNAVALIMIIGLFVVYYVQYHKMLWSDDIVGLIIYALVCFAFIIVHEGIHAISYGLCTPNRFRNIEFGIIPSKGAAYCVCMEPLPKKAQIISLVMPGIILGIIPTIIAIIIKDYTWIAIGITQIISAGGDIWMLLKIGNIKTKSKDALFIENDSKTHCTYYVLDKE